MAYFETAVAEQGSLDIFAVYLDTASHLVGQIRYQLSTTTTPASTDLL